MNQAKGRVSEPKVVVSAKIEPKLKQRLQELCAEANKTESEFVRDVLKDCAKMTDPDSVRSMSRRLSAVERQLERLAAVERKLEVLAALVIEAGGTLP